MIRVEFKLTMPGRGRAVSSSFGEGRHYARVMTLTNKAVAKLLGPDWDKKPPENSRKSFYHHWTDGWTAQVTARVMFKGEKAKKSDGFAGYDWMISNILQYGDTTKPGEVPA